MTGCVGEFSQGFTDERAPLALDTTSARSGPFPSILGVEFVALHGRQPSRPWRSQETLALLIQHDAFAQLKLAAFGVYAALVGYAGRDGLAHVSIGTLARKTGSSYNTINRHLRSLEEAGLIEIRKGQASSTYVMLEFWHDDDDESLIGMGRPVVARRPVNNFATPPSVSSVTPPNETESHTTGMVTSPNEHESTPPNEHESAPPLSQRRKASLKPESRHPQLVCTVEGDATDSEQPEAEPLDMARVDHAERLLVDVGFSSQQIDDVWRSFGQFVDTYEQIQIQTSNYRHDVSRGTEISNPAGWIYRAIERRYRRTDRPKMAFGESRSTREARDSVDRQAQIHDEQATARLRAAWLDETAPAVLFEHRDAVCADLVARDGGELAQRWANDDPRKNALLGAACYDLHRRRASDGTSVVIVET